MIDLSALQPTRREATEAVRKLLTPTVVTSHKHRERRLASVCGEIDFRSVYFDPANIETTFDGTQFDGENHRRLTPHLQELFATDRDRLMRAIDRECILIGERDMSKAIVYDVAIIGSGPHGVAVAANIRERYPKLKTIIIEKGSRLGGQWRSYGPKPAFMMNSRVRPANRNLPALPRTPGSINPLGTHVPLELSDVVVGNYAMNTDMGDVCAINGFLSATSIMVGAEVTGVYGGTITVDSGSYFDYQIQARTVVDATGIGQQSTLESGKDFCFSTAGFYRLFANEARPLERFHNRTVAVIGAGDSALTVLEALLGTLPARTYGAFGVGRLRPARIDWIGAPGSSAAEIDPCLRSRYKNGIVQALQKGGIVDEGALISTRRFRAERVYRTGTGLGIQSTGFGSSVGADIVIDCTNQKVRRKPNPDWKPDHRVGPNSGRIPQRIKTQIERLGISENAVALWATMCQTNSLSMKIGEDLSY